MFRSPLLGEVDVEGEMGMTRKELASSRSEDKQLAVQNPPGWRERVVVEGFRGQRRASKVGDGMVLRPERQAGATAGRAFTRERILLSV